MFLHIEIDGSTKAYQLRALSQLCATLALGAEGETPNLISAEAVGGEQTTAPEVAPEVPETTAAATQETTRRRRRTKAEIEADEAAAKEAREVAKIEAEETYGEAGVEAGETETVNTETGEITGNTEEAPADDFEKVEQTTPAAGGKTYTQAEVQALASAIARTKGPQLVKDKIAELGVDRIGALTQEGIDALGAYLEAQK